MRAPTCRRLILASAVAAWAALVGATTGPPTVRSAGPSVEVAVPEPGTTLVAGPTFRLGWREAAPRRAPIVARTISQYSGAVTEAGTCARAVYTLDWIDAGTVPPERYPLSGLAGGFCHYWIVAVRDAEGAVSHGRSGYVLGTSAGDPRVAFTFPLRGADALVPPGPVSVRWDERSSDGVASRAILELVTSVRDGACDPLGWLVRRSLPAISPSISLDDLEAGTCYRYAVTVRDAEGRVAQARSGPLHVSASPPACAYADVSAGPFGTDAWATLPLDTTYALPSDYVPPDLVRTRGIRGMSGTFRIRRVAYDDLEALADAARAAGSPIDLSSAYRSYAEQQRVLALYIELAGPARGILLAARPGHSEHQLGTAVDVTAAGGRSPQQYRDWATTRTGAWLRDHAWRYGWVMSYPKGPSPERTCYQYEPWHYRYVGRELARGVHASGLSLREYLWQEGILRPAG